MAKRLTTKVQRNSTATTQKQSESSLVCADFKASLLANPYTATAE